MVLWGHREGLVAMAWGGKGPRALLVHLARLAPVASLGHAGLLARPASAVPRVGVGLGGLARLGLLEGMVWQDHLGIRLLHAEEMWRKAKCRFVSFEGMPCFSVSNSWLPIRLPL